MNVNEVYLFPFFFFTVISEPSNFKVNGGNHQKCFCLACQEGSTLERHKLFLEDFNSHEVGSVSTKYKFYKK